MSSLEYFETVDEYWDLLRKNMFSENTRVEALKIAQVRAGDIAAHIRAASEVKQLGRLARKPGPKFLKTA